MIEREQPLIRQSRFIEVKPPADLHLLNQQQDYCPKFVPGPDYLPITEKRTPRVATSISKIETWLPYILYRQGENNDYLSPETNPSLEQASIIGQELHQADVLFNLVIQGNIGQRVAWGLPTASQADIDLYGQATQDTFFEANTKPEWLINHLIIAWEKFLSLRQQQEKTKIGSLPMFTNTNLPDPGDKSLTFQILQSQQLKDLGLNLAQHWVDKCLSPHPHDWDYSIEHQSLNETFVVFNLDKLQIRCRFDRITRPEKSKKTLQIQVSDFKTGHPQPNNHLQVEIKQRQAQLMLLAAEHFAGKYILDKNWLKHRGSAYILNLVKLDRNIPDRVRFFYRWFDKQTGQVTKEEVKFDRGQRGEFLDWFDWYSSKVQEYKQDLKKIS